MKNKIFFVAVLSLCYSFSFSQSKSDSLKIVNLSESVSELKEKIREIGIENEKHKEKEKEKGYDMEDIIYLLKIATWVVESLVALTALFVIFHLWSFNREKKKISLKFNEGEKKISDILSKAEKKINHKLEEVEKKQSAINQVSDRVFAVENKILNAKEHYKLGFDNLFTFIEDYINKKGDRKTMESLFLKRGIIDIYDDKAEKRLNGIFALSQYGKVADIKHLEKIISDISASEEDNENKKIALEAIIQIRDRYKLFSPVENERFKAISVLIQNGGSDDITGLEKIISNAGESERNIELAKQAIEAIKLRVKK